MQTINKISISMSFIFLHKIKKNSNKLILKNSIQKHLFFFLFVFFFFFFLMKKIVNSKKVI